MCIFLVIWHFEFEFQRGSSSKNQNIHIGALTAVVIFLPHLDYYVLSCAVFTDTGRKDIVMLLNVMKQKPTKKQRANTTLKKKTQKLNNDVNFQKL